MIWKTEINHCSVSELDESLEVHFVFVVYSYMLLLLVLEFKNLF